MSRENYDSYSNIEEELIEFSYKDNEKKEISLEKYLEMYQFDEMARKIVDYVVDDAIREGWNILHLNDNLKKKIEQNFLKLDGYRKIESATKTARLYGTSYILIIRKNQNLSKQKIDTKILHLKVVTPREIKGKRDEIDHDINSSNFGFPKLYEIQLDNKILNIHYSHLIRFDNDYLNYSFLKENQFRGISVLSGLYYLLNDYKSIFDKVQNILKNWQTVIFKTDLSEIVTSDEQLEAMKKKLYFLARSRENYNIVAINEMDSFDIKEHQFPEVVSILDKIEKRIVSNTKYPHTVLLGGSPSGLGATGHEEHRNYLAFVKQVQENLIHKPLVDIYTELSKEFEGCGDIDISYPSLEVKSDMDKFEEFKILSNTLKVNIDTGIMSKEKAIKIIEKKYEEIGN